MDIFVCGIKKVDYYYYISDIFKLSHIFVVCIILKIWWKNRLNTRKKNEDDKKKQSREDIKFVCLYLSLNKVSVSHGLQLLSR